MSEIIRDKNIAKFMTQHKLYDYDSTVIINYSTIPLDIEKAGSSFLHMISHTRQ